MDTIITVKNLKKVYRIGSEKVVALDGINLTIERGQVCCILGTSGSGKSTLLNMLAGLERPTTGAVLLGNNDITRMSEKNLAVLRQKNIGFIFQSYNLMQAMTALENVSLPLVFKGMPKAQRERAARKMLKSVGLLNRAVHRPSQMSGGQQQRVGIARAFVASPKIVFADEPTGNLDTATSDEVMKIMIDVARNTDLTLVLVTHDTEIARYADRIITLKDGKIISDVGNESIVPKLPPKEPAPAALKKKSGENPLDALRRLLARLSGGKTPTQAMPPGKMPAQADEAEPVPPPVDFSAMKQPQEPPPVQEQPELAQPVQEQPAQPERNLRPEQAVQQPDDKKDE